MSRPLVVITTGASDFVLLDLNSSITDVMISSKQKVGRKEADGSVNE